MIELFQYVNVVGWLRGILTPSQLPDAELFITVPSIVRIVCASKEDEFISSRISIVKYLIRDNLFNNGYLPLFLSLQLYLQIEESWAFH